MTSQRAAVTDIWTTQEPSGMGPKKFESFFYDPTNRHLGQLHKDNSDLQPNDLVLKAAVIQ